ncbi:hypothetical protein CFO_g5394 [Ceratocystis platani]|uniref:Uncharacterized protein n=1 Tax=Ceratocystis fimbriata f. sp. platani TaxID=88771 RepID=A0A0F8AZD6_CERFI|nr:hypothetical protein CFO_g5394 [Ceratocystis platani]
MKPSSFLPVGISISCISGGCGSGLSKALEAPQGFDIESSTEIGSTSGIGPTADVQSAADIESVTEYTESFYDSSDEDEATEDLPPVSDDPTSHHYLWNHLYYHIIGDYNIIQFYTPRFSREDQRVVVRILADREQKFTRVYDNFLEFQTPDPLNLDIEEIYHALCHEYKTDYTDMNWIGMDIVDEVWRETIRLYRQDHGFDPTMKIRVTPGHPDWDLFITNRYFLDATRMVPNTDVLEISVRREVRPQFKDPRKIVVADVITFWFKEPESSEEDNAIDPPRQYTAVSSSKSKPAIGKSRLGRPSLQDLFDETKDEHNGKAGNVENVGNSGNPENVGNDKNGGSAAHGENDSKLEDDAKLENDAKPEDDAKLENNAELKNDAELESDAELEDEDYKALNEAVSSYVWGSLWSFKSPSSGETDNAESAPGPSDSETVPEIVPASS